MKYKKYFRKTSLKQKGDGDFFLEEIKKKKPKYFLEVGVFHGVTARNVCELLFKIHKNDFKYVGLDLFEKSEENKSEIIPNTKFSNPFKQIYFKFIKRQDPYSIEAVEDLLSDFKNNIHLIKGNSNTILKKIDMSKINYVFLDGGHDFETVRNDLNSCTEVVDNGGTILCDDYNLSYAPGVKKAIDEYVKKKNYKCEILLNSRFARIERQ
ncbi:class I SAM-dependent methyltransferase [Pelagibacterales bacterium SAG-MED24]|nr:class I SAM-dependent methyltransferase [Pelagibacterales bacterium SAG-MED24]